MRTRLSLSLSPGRWGGQSVNRTKRTYAAISSNPSRIIPPDAGFRKPTRLPAEKSIINTRRVSSRPVAPHPTLDLHFRTSLCPRVRTRWPTQECRRRPTALVNKLSIYCPCTHCACVDTHYRFYTYVFSRVSTCARQTDPDVKDTGRNAVG